MLLIGIGGFNASLRKTRPKEREDPGEGDVVPDTPPVMMEEKPRRKPQRRKPKSKLAENYPSYLQVFTVHNIVNNLMLQICECFSSYLHI